MINAGTIHDLIAPVCPIKGVSMGTPDNKASWVVLFDDAATDQQKTAARAVIDAFNPLAPTPAMIAAERDRRLALGFKYDFGDARGVHHIGTTPADMVGWREVSDYAGSLLDSGDVTTKIAIETDTGKCQVTAPEWSAIKIAAAMFRQPIWARSFVLQESLPTDYTADAKWS